MCTHQAHFKTPQQAHKNYIFQNSFDQSVAGDDFGFYECVTWTNLFPVEP